MNQLEKEKRNIQNKDIKNKNKEINGKSHFDGEMLRNIAIICVITIFLLLLDYLVIDLLKKHLQVEIQARRLILS